LLPVFWGALITIRMPKKPPCLADRRPCYLTS
jgi:hypothetical protein